MFLIKDLNRLLRGINCYHTITILYIAFLLWQDFCDQLLLSLTKKKNFLVNDRNMNFILLMRYSSSNHISYKKVASPESFDWYSVDIGIIQIHVICK